MEEEVHLLEKIFGNLPSRDFVFKVRKGAHWGHPSPPHHHGDQGRGSGCVGEKCGGWWRWFGWREGEGESWRHFFYFPQPLAFFGFSPHNFLIGAKMHKSKKETKGGIHDPILTPPECGHRGGEPNGGGGGGCFFFWVDGHWRQEEIWKLKKLKN